MADFTELKVQSGVGDYHFNRYRVVFQAKPGITKHQLAMLFVKNFPKYLKSDFAKVEFRNDHQFEGKPTMKFHGFMKWLGLDLAAPHSDWVVQHECNPTRGFTAQTLKREFKDAFEDLAAGAGGAPAGGLVGAVGGPVPSLVSGLLTADAASQANRKHFLAGRRAWRLDDASAFGIASDALVLETVAVERLSSIFYQDIIGAFVDLESMIPPIWIANLTNFVRAQFLTPVSQSPPFQPWKQSTKHDNGVCDVNYFNVINIKNLSALCKNVEFIKTLQLYPAIISFGSEN